MTDQNSQFFAILTAVGEAKQANANALGVPWTFAQMGVGDANLTDPIPSRTQTRLINERRRALLNQVKVDPNNASIIIAEQVIPPDSGGWWIREIGLYDADGDLVAVANCAPSFKPLLSQGTGKTQVVRLNIIVTSTANVQLKIDPAVVLATREYVDSAILTVLPLTKVPGVFTQVQINARGIVQQGWNPTTLVGYGITDALNLAGGTLTGDLKIDGKGIYLYPPYAQSWKSGIMSTGRQGQVYAGIGFWGDDENVGSAFMGLGETPWESGNGVRVTMAGVRIAGPLTASGSGLTGVPFAALTGLPSSLSGHGIATVPFGVLTGLPAALSGWGVAFASQAEAEGGADVNKPMNALRVFQAIAAKVVQATGSAMGVARIASQLAVNAGTDALSIVTPKTLANGLTMIIGAQGCICLPSWLGGLMLQWGTGPAVAASQTISITYPLAFPNGHFMTCICNNYAGGDSVVRSSLGVVYQGNAKFDVSAAGTFGQPSVPWFSIGY